MNRPTLPYLVLLAILPMVLPTLRVAAKLWSRTSPGQFGLRTLFAALTIAAVGFGIGRVPMHWQIKLTVLWTLWLCLLAALNWTLRPRQ